MTRDDIHRDHSVVDLTSRFAEGRYGALAEVEAYWEARREGRIMPERRDIDPRGIAGALSHSFLGETLAPGAIRLRIAGAGLSDLLGMEVRGLPLSTFFIPAARGTLAIAIEQTLQRPAVTVLTLSSKAGAARPALSARMLLLPLASEDGRVDRILGVLEARGTVGRTPRRFDILAQRSRRIEIPWPNWLHNRAILPRSSALAEMAAPPMPQTRRGGHLRLVADNG